MRDPIRDDPPKSEKYRGNRGAECPEVKIGDKYKEKLHNLSEGNELKLPLKMHPDPRKSDPPESETSSCPLKLPLKMHHEPPKSELKLPLKMQPDPRKTVPPESETSRCPLKLPLKMHPEPPKSDPPESETGPPLKNAFTVLKYKKPTPPQQEKTPKVTKKVNQPNQPRTKHPKKNKNLNPVKTKITPLETTPSIKIKTQQTIIEMIKAKKETKPRELQTPKPPLIKPPTLFYRNQEETNPNPKPKLEPNQELNQPKPDFDIKPAKPVTKPEPAQRLKPVRKEKAAVLQNSDLKSFLQKKKKERELKQSMNLNVVVRTNISPSVLRDNATLLRPPDSLLMNTPADSEIINGRDLGNSALNGTTEKMSGDLQLAQSNENLGEQPIM